MDLKYLFVSMEIWGTVFCLFMLFALIILLDKENKEKNIIVHFMTVAAAILLADAGAWLFRGEEGFVQGVIVRLANFMCFYLWVPLIGSFGAYLRRLIGARKERTFFRCLNVAFGLLPVVVLVIAHFTNLFYYYEGNLYHRAAYYPVYFLSMVPLTGSVVYFAYRHRKELKAEGVSPLKYALPLLAAAAIQIFVYGYPLLNIALVMTAILIFADIIRKEAAAARARELTIVNQKNMLRDLRTRIAVSQIKPHFLFTVLNTIYVLCDLDVKKGREAISDLTDYLRTNIGSIDSDEPILFSEEMHYVEAYLKLEKLRFPDVIHVEYDLRDEEFRIPALSIQPLVENAVRHGIRKRKGGGTILIRAVREGDFHVITVHDNGAGFTPEEIPKDDPNHIGIRNVRERLELISGAKMNINSVPGNGTTVTIRVPACTA